MRLFTIFVPFLVTTKYTLMCGWISICKSICNLSLKKTAISIVYAKTRWYIYVYVRITTISNRGTELLKISNIALDFVVLIFFMIDFDIAQNDIFFNLKVIYK